VQGSSWPPRRDSAEVVQTLSRIRRQKAISAEINGEKVSLQKGINIDLTGRTKALNIRFQVKALEAAR
jgi:hypothetical protein